MTPSSSRNSRSSAYSSVSPGSTLPPGNSHMSSNLDPRGRWHTSSLPSDWIRAATTVSTEAVLSRVRHAKHVAVRILKPSDAHLAAGQSTNAEFILRNVRESLKGQAIVHE